MAHTRIICFQGHNYSSYKRTLWKSMFCHGQSSLEESISIEIKTQSSNVFSIRDLWFDYTTWSNCKGHIIHLFVYFYWISIYSKTSSNIHKLLSVYFSTFVCMFDLCNNMFWYTVQLVNTFFLIFEHFSTNCMNCSLRIF